MVSERILLNIIQERLSKIIRERRRISRYLATFADVEFCCFGAQSTVVVDQDNGLPERFGECSRCRFTHISRRIPIGRSIYISAARLTA